MGVRLAADLLVMLALYRLASCAAGPVARLVLARRARRGKEDRARLPERLGHAGCTRPDGALIWVHGASVGEALSALALIEKLLAARADLSVLVTTGTVTSARLLGERLPPRAFHQFAPIDLPGAVRRFLDHWRPDLGIWLESELWPNLLNEAGARMTLALVNGRMSAHAYERWRLVPQMARGLLKNFALGFAQSGESADYFRALGMSGIRHAGNLKYAAAELPADEAERKRFAAAIGARPCWIAASTHPGEEEMIARCHRRVGEQAPGLLTFLAPRHPARADAVAGLLAESGLRVSRRSRNELPRPETDIYLIDSLGELGLFYRLAPVAFIGGSLVRHGGHNPLEPARLGAAVLHGPDMRNFRDIATTLDEAGAGEEAADETALAERVGFLLAHPDECATRRDGARRAGAQQTKILDVLAQTLLPLLPPLPTERSHAGA